ncbi:MAG TPA: hypothetical protein VGE07_29655 [Herpetosiphonaceae bacterium]
MFRRFVSPLLALALASIALLAPGPAPAAGDPLAGAAARHYLPMVTKQNRSAIIKVREQLRWVYASNPIKSYDLVIIADHSTAAGFCWDTQTACPVGERRADGEAEAIRRIVQELLVTRNGQGADNRLTLITYGHLGRESGAAHPQILFNMPTSEALGRFQSIYGTPAQPRAIPAQDLTGQGALPEALALAEEAFTSTQRYVDANGQPVHRITLVFVAGVPNVFVDAPERWSANQGLWRVPCNQRDAPDSNLLYDARFQYSCPSSHPYYPGLRPPLRAAVELADTVRPQDPGRSQVDTVAALALGAGPTPESLRFPLLAPTANARAATPAAAEAWVGQFLASIDDRRCVVGVEPLRDAAGAEVQIFRDDGALAFAGTTNQAGTVTAALPEGEYELEIRHDQVVAPLDRQAIARDYGKIITAAAPAPATRAPLTVPGNVAFLEFVQEAMLTITDPATAACL